jgi:thioredoxin 2
MPDTRTQIIHCTACGAANRIPAERPEKAARCGKCHVPLPRPGDSPQESYKIRCTECGTKNRIPANRLEAGPKCGKCGSTLKTRELFIPQPVMITDANFEQSVMKSPLPVLMFAWAPWCPTCGAVAPIIDQFATESKGKVRVAKINVDASPALASRFNIMSVPFLFIFDNGQLKESMPGGLQKHEIMMKMAPYI